MFSTGRQHLSMFKLVKRVRPPLKVFTKNRRISRLKASAAAQLQVIHQNELAVPAEPRLVGQDHQQATPVARVSLRGEKAADGDSAPRGIDGGFLQN